MNNPTTTSSFDIDNASLDQGETTFVPAANRKSRQAVSSSASSTTTSEAVLTIPADRVKVVKNIRTIDKKGVEQLAQSIRNEGQLSPIVVQKIDDDSYGIVFGHRRHAAIALNAAKHGGDGLVRCTVRNNINPDDLPFIQLTENLQREDMRDSETALTLAQLKTQRGMSTKDLAARVSLGERQVRNYIQIGLAPDFIRRFLDTVEVTVKLKDEHGKAMLAADGSPITESRELPGLAMEKVIALINHHAELDAAESVFIKATPSYKPKAEKQTRALAQQCAVNEWTKQQLTDRIKKLRSTSQSDAGEEVEVPRAPYRITKDVIHLDLPRVKTMSHADRRAMAAALQAALIALDADVFLTVDIRGA